MDKSRFSIFTHEGMKLAADVTCTDCLKPCGEYPKRLEWNTPCDFSCGFEIKLTEKDKEIMKAIQDLLYNDVEKQLSEFYAKVNEIAEHIVRNYVTPPIKGEITKGKVRWRGLQIVWQKTDGYYAFVGIRQRDVLIFPDGKKIPWDSLCKIDE